MMEAIEAAVSSERGATGAVGVGGEAQGATFHMNQSSGGSGSTDGEGGGLRYHVRGSISSAL